MAASYSKAVKPKPVNVLIVDDSAEDTELIVLELQRAGLAPAFRQVDSPSAMIGALEEQAWDVVLCDYIMPLFNAAEAFSILRHRALDIPFLIVSGSVHDETAIDLMRKGARDIVMKANLTRLGLSVLRELETLELRRQAEEAAGQSEQRLRALIENSSDGLLLLDENGRTVYCGFPILGYTPEEVSGRTVFELIHADDQAQTRAHFEQVKAAPGQAMTTEYRARHKDGSWRWIESVRKNLLHDPAVGAIVVNYRDITERKQLDEQLRQTQRLESLGVLAGGVAHDFNNLLTGILGNASLALDTLPRASQERPWLESVVDACEQAANFTRQLLAYTGKGAFIIQQVDLSQLIEHISPLLRTSVVRNVELQFDLAPDLPPIDADIGQLQQVIMNLVINGAEAIGEGKSGAVLVAAKGQDLVQDLCQGDIHANFQRNELLPGRYVVLEVQDTGCGMDEATQARIFDPFFTTKFMGRGLGLAAVQGIMRRHQGLLRVYSRLGQGTTFKVFFPASRVESIKTRQIIHHAEDLGGAGRILVVDNEPTVRQAAKNTLERYGYSVVLADNGRMALDLFQAMAGQISLVLLDLTMPVMGGEEALAQLRKIRANIPVILCSGFNEGEALMQFGQYSPAAFIQKPYTAGRLAERVKTVLELSKK